MFLLMFVERCFSGIVNNLLKTSPASGFIIFRLLGECIVLHQTFRVAGVSQFACVQLYGFHSSFLIVSSTEGDPRSQHLVVSPTVCCTHFGVLQMSILSRHLVMMKSIICTYWERECVQVVLGAYFCLNMVLYRTQYILPIEARRWN